MEIPKWNGRWALYYKYNGRVIQFYYSDASLLQGEIEAYHTIDLTYTQNFLRGKWQLQFGGKNLMNVTNLNFNGNSGVHGSSSGTMPMAWGRSYFLAVNWKFSKS
jgi:outer membrane receptor for ferrienterochelin and colicins